MHTHVPLGLGEQITLVTGGARGLGRRIVEAFLREGARVVINFHSSQHAAHELARSRPDTALAIGADVRDRSAVNAMFSRAEEHFGAPVTTVVNNALLNFYCNVAARSGAGALAYSEFAEQFDGSIRAAVNTPQAAVPAFSRAGTGLINNITTGLCQEPVVLYHDYTAAMAGLL